MAALLRVGDGGVNFVAGDFRDEITGTRAATDAPFTGTVTLQGLGNRFNLAAATSSPLANATLRLSDGNRTYVDFVN